MVRGVGDEVMCVCGWQTFLLFFSPDGRNYDIDV